MARGSRKGEKRGAAKGGVTGRGGNGPTKRPRGRPPGPSKKAQKRVVELLDIAGIVCSEPSKIMPREMLLEGMRTLYAMALDLQKRIRELLELQGAQKAMQLAREKAERMMPVFTNYILMAAEMAYKAAPLYHARIQAVAMLPGGDQRTETILTAIMDDIDTAERERRESKLRAMSGDMLTIDHVPTQQ